MLKLTRDTYSMLSKNMGHWNMQYSGPGIDIYLDQQGQGYFHPEPSIVNGSMLNFCSVPAPGNISNFDVHHHPEHYAAASYGMTRFNGVHHQYPATNVDLTCSAPNHYNMLMTPSVGNRVFPVPLNHVPLDPFPLSSNNGMVEASADSYGWSSHAIDGSGGSFKRKDAEDLSTNYYFCYASTGFGSSGALVIPRVIESYFTPMDIEFAVPDGRGLEAPSVMDVGSNRSVRYISGIIAVDSVLPHNTNCMIQGPYPSQPFQIASTHWIDKSFNFPSGSVGSLSWNHPHALPYLHVFSGNFNGGSAEAANMGVQSYQATARNRNPATFLSPPIIPQGHFNLHHPPPPIQGTRGHNAEVVSQVAASLRRLSTSNTSPSSMNYVQDCVEPGCRFFSPTPPTGLRIHLPYRRELTLDSTARPRNLHNLRVLPEDEVALLELSDYHDMGESVDHHRDMRLDIDHMSYEELLVLGEQIGSVGSGLSEEIVRSHLKSKLYVPIASCSEDTITVDNKLNFCVICQNEYKGQEMIGILECTHDYHLECIKRWLLVKNRCPICKSVALTTLRKEW